MAILRGRDIPADQMAEFKDYFTKDILLEFAAPSPPADHFYRLRNQLGDLSQNGSQRSGAR